jgi:ParB family chromosome partitioning protein
LGRGLDALIPQGSGEAVREIDPDRIEANPYQPRQRFEAAALQELAGSIREHGVVQPVVVARVGDDRYRLIVGERRLRAARLAGLERIPALVKDAGDRQSLELALIENIQRADLNPLEEAGAYQRLIDDFGLKQQEVAARVGKSRTAVANTLRLLSLPDFLKVAVNEGRVSEGHARALLGLSDEKAQRRILTRIESQGLTVRQVETLVREAANPERRALVIKDPNVEAVESELRRSLGTKVSLRPGRRGGKIIIEYFSDDDFQGLFARLTGGRSAS